jgi:CRISPR-associated protein Csm1
MNGLDKIVLGTLLQPIVKMEKFEDLTASNFLRDFPATLLQEWATISNTAPSPQQRLIAAALQLAHPNGESSVNAQEASSEITPNDKNYLTPLLEQLSISSPPPRNSIYLQPLCELTLDQDTIYPNPRSEWNTDEWQNESEQLIDAFQTALQQLPPINHDDDYLPNVVANLVALLARYTAFMPANQGSRETSQFDVIRVAAAIAEGLYRHHQQYDNFTTADFLEPTTPKWRLVAGDFAGIETFLFQLTADKAIHALRGRALYLQCFCQAICQHLLHQLDLYPTALLYATSGKFYLLIAQHQEAELQDAIQPINRWLTREFAGLIHLGIGSVSINAFDFLQGTISEKWHTANELAEQSHSQPATMPESMHSYFQPQPVAEQACQICGRNELKHHIRTQTLQQDSVPAPAIPMNRWEIEPVVTICHQCQRLERFGQHNSQANYLLWVWQNDRQTVRAALKNQPVYRFRTLGCDLYLLTQAPELTECGPLPQTKLEKINDANYLAKNTQGYGEYFHFIAKWDSDKPSAQWDYQSWVQLATGSPQLGIFHLDVDNLTSIFRYGIYQPTLAKIATLSRQLQLFFSGHLFSLIKDYQRTQILYAGEDDLWLIGAWDELPEVAFAIQQAFSQYCAFNPDLTLTGSLTLLPPSPYPLYKLFDLAQQTQNHAKQLNYLTEQQRKTGKPNHEAHDASPIVTKNTCSLFEVPISWQMYPTMLKFRDLLSEIITKSGNNHAIITRLRGVILALQAYENRASDYQLKNIQQLNELIMYQRWRWQLVSNLTHLGYCYPNASRDLKKLQNIIFSNDIDREKLSLPVSEWLPLPVRWAELLIL